MVPAPNIDPLPVDVTVLPPNMDGVVLVAGAPKANGLALSLTVADGDANPVEKAGSAPREGVAAVCVGRAVAPIMVAGVLETIILEVEAELVTKVETGKVVLNEPKENPH